MSRPFIDSIVVEGFTEIQKKALTNKMLEKLQGLGIPEKILKKIIYWEPSEDGIDVIVITSVNLHKTYPDLVSVVRGEMLRLDCRMSTLIKVKHRNGTTLIEKTLGDFT